MLTKAEIQRLRSLREKKHREELGLFVVEGEKVVGELLSANFPFAEIYATPKWLEDRRSNLPETRSRGAETADAPTSAHTGFLKPWIIPLSDAEMARVSHFPTPSAVLAVGRIERTPLPPAELGRGVTLALDGVQDAGNVGTLLRIADWFALDRVLLSPDCADLFHQKVINASMGSFARVPVHTVDLAATLAGTKATVIGCDLAGDNVHSLPGLRDAVVVIGSEGRGLSASVQRLITRRVTIPRFGRAESLNAAVAAGIVCDQLRRSPS